MRGAKPRVFIIILNWKDYQTTLSCVESVKSLDYPNFKVVVVDNGSPNESERMLRKKLSKGIHLIQTGENLGYAGGNNLGIRYALNRGADYVLILNPDTLLEPGVLDELVKMAESKPQIGLTGPKLYYADKKNKIWGFGGNIDWLQGITPMVGQGEEDTGQFDEAREFDRLTGSCLLIKRRVFDKIGLFPEDYFLYYEETDFCLRARKAGFKLVYVPSAIVWHNAGSSVGRDSPTRLYYFARNTLVFLWRWAPWWAFFTCWWTYMNLFGAIKELRILLRERCFRSKFIKIAAIEIGVFDFLRGKRGKGPDWLE